MSERVRVLVYDAAVITKGMVPVACLCSCRCFRWIELRSCHALRTRMSMRGASLRPNRSLMARRVKRHIRLGRR
jgi:hypothetical protein